jgi:hypothetical protein
MRRESFPRRLFAVSLLSVSALAACTGLLLSQAASCNFKDANEVCKERFAIAIPKLNSFRIEFWGESSGSELTPGFLSFA